MIAYKTGRTDRYPSDATQLTLVTTDNVDDCTRVLHYMVSPDFGDDVGYDIKSYRDLQRFSAGRNMNVIGREKYVLHVKETIPGKLVGYQSLVYPHLLRYYESGPYQKTSSRFWHAWDTRTTNTYHQSLLEVRSKDVLGSVTGNLYRMFWEANNRKWFYRFTLNDSRYPNSKSGDIRAEIPSFRSFSEESRDEFHSRYLSLSQQECEQLYIHRGRYGRIVDEPNYKISITKDDWPTRSTVPSGWYTTTLKDVSGSFDPSTDYTREFTSQGYHLRPAGLEAALCAEALSDTSFNTNSIANMLDLFDLAVSIKNFDFMDMVKSVKRSGMIGTASDSWLKYRYVYSTTKSDFEELLRYATNGDPTVMRAHGNDAAGQMQVKVMAVPKSNQLGVLVNRLTKAGVAPNLYNLWDLVPFSFIVDWFVDIGGFLEDLTQYGRCAAFDVKSVTTSWHWYDKFDRAGVTAEIEFYEREVSSAVPPYVPYVEQRSVSGGTTLKRAIDTVALIS